jgi:transposase-like protein
MAQRKRYGGEFKAKVVLEAIAGHRTINEIASAYGVHPTQIANWKREVVAAMPQILSNGKRAADTNADETIARLYQQIGQLTMEAEFLKKKLGLCR